MCLRNLTFVTFLLLFTFNTQAQRNFEGYNRLGLQAGMTLFDINTADLTTRQGTGFMGGFTTRGSFRGSFDLIYGINFFGNELEVLAINTGDASNRNVEEYIDYSIQAVQINFLGSFNVVRHHFSLEFGPVLNVNGRLKMKNEDNFGQYILAVDDAIIRANEIQDISKVNFRVMGGLTAGLENFRVWAQYQYGVTNMLKNLNDKELAKNDFEGNSSTLIFGAVVYF
ncbi:hypothetical protein J1N09_08790 [Aureitalea sp. L0-47]|uniref:hypothetical protein n=1 Tax=Aureitalea sp. L0-47 TaxID=2816962 RepID=UPI0022372FF9|nr:hypothetical protein [Aureitalea sp. L0-47]MCW5519931.1 hypothetical protein [Aureitalea sp. L0-47]